MISWTITAAPSVVTASSYSESFSSADDITDESGEIKATATGSRIESYSALTDSQNNKYQSAFVSQEDASAYSFYDTNGGLGPEEDSGSAIGSTSSSGISSWDGQRTLFSSINGSSTLVSASSTTRQTTRDTSTTTNVTAIQQTTTTQASTTLTGTTTENGAATTASTSTTQTQIAFATITQTAAATTTQTSSVSQYGINGDTWTPTYGQKTVALLANSVLWSVTSPVEGHFSAGAVSVSGRQTLSSNFALRQGVVTTVTDTATFTRTSAGISGTESGTTNSTSASSLSTTIYAGESVLPLLSAETVVTKRTTTSAQITVYTSNASAAADIPTIPITVAQTTSFIPNFDSVLTLSQTIGTSLGSDYADYVSVGSDSNSWSSGPSDFNGSPITNKTTTASTNNYEFQESLFNGYNFQLGGAQTSAGQYPVFGWAAASNFDNRAQRIVANVGSLTMPFAIKGNQTVFGFVGTTTFSNTTRSGTVSVNGSNIFVTTASGTNSGTLSAQIQTQGTVFTQTVQNEVTSPGGRAGVGVVSAAIRPGAYFTTAANGDSGTQLLTSGKNTTLGATHQKTAMLPMPYCVGSRGPLKLFYTNRNQSDI